MATCCSRRDIAAAVKLGPESPTGTISHLCLAPKKEVETCREAAARAGCPDMGPGWLPLSAVLLQEP